MSSSTATPLSPELIRPVADDVLRSTQIGRFLTWLNRTRGLTFDGYDDLHRWSVTDLAGFWSAIWEYYEVHSDTPYRQPLVSTRMPGAQWFPGATLNYAQHALAARPGAPMDGEVAIIAHSQTREPLVLTWGELREEVARTRKGLQRLGIGRGDRVAAYLPNIPETVVAFLATASLGATWAACAPEFGARSVIDRFAQIEPTVLLTIAGYGYGAKDIDRRADVELIRAGLPTVTSVIHVPYGPNLLPDSVSWDDLRAETGDRVFEPVPFEHPLCVLFSSGTTGKPKAIVHCHGGILLEHLKNHSLSWDLKPGDRMLWFSTTAWMMWNALVSGLLVGSSIVLVDGNPLFPDLTWQWRLAQETGATLMGASPGFLMACRKEGIAPAEEFDLSRIRQIGAAGSPLPAEGFHWVAEQFGPGVLLNVGSGGTDVCSGIVQGSPLQPVWAGEISGPCLGVAAKAFDEHGHEVPAGELGELVITAPMPSMPVGFWGDDDGSRYRAAYFDEYPGIWRHGDWIRFSRAGSCVIAGRSDATLNRGGVRLGTAEFYRVVEELPGVIDSLVVHLEDPAGGNGELLLYVQLQPGVDLDDALRSTIITALRTSLSPRHIPDTVTAVPAIPRNRTGKKLELPVKKILLGADLDDVASREVLADPSSLDPYVEHAATPEKGMSGNDIRRVAVVGTGVIGASWVAHFLAQGLDVVATDPAPAAEARLRTDVAGHWPILTELGLVDGASQDRLAFTADLDKAVSDADFVQENGPERIDLKHALFAQLDRATTPEVVLASSSSGLLPSAIQDGCPEHPERVLIGHPFNPPHLIPLVEVVPGSLTSESVVDRAVDFYIAVGKRPIRLRQEVPGHVANRLQAALWREAYSLVDRGIASVADIDTAISQGPGLRWAVLGPFVLQHLSGGPGGMAHNIEHLGPPMVAWWDDLRQPDLTPELAARLVAGVDEELAGLDQRKLVEHRDAVLNTLLTAKRQAYLP